MPRKNRPATCRTCQATASDGAVISWRGYCFKCGTERMERNAVALHLHEGPEHDYWRRRHAAAVGAVLVDDLLALD